MNEMSFADFGNSEFLTRADFVISFVVEGVKNYNNTVEPPYRIDQGTYRAELDITGHPAEQSISIVEMFKGGKLAFKDFDGNVGVRDITFRGSPGSYYLHVTLENIPYGKVQCTLYELKSADGKVRWRNPDA